jgi:FAD-linked oxidoreductase
MADWKNWSGMHAAQPKLMAKPQTIEQLQEVVKTAPGPIRVTGSGHSFTQLVPSDGTIVSVNALSGLKGHDGSACTATVGAGTRLGELTQILHGIDQALANMGDIDQQTLAGALGTATHGTGSTLGAYHTLVEDVELVDGKGAVRRYSKSDNAEMLQAIGVALGCFGILTQVTLKNMQSYRLHKRRYVLPISDMLANFFPMMQGHRSAEFFYVPFSSSAIFVSSDLTDEPATSRPPEEDEDGLKTLKMLRTYLRYIPWARRKLIAGALRKMPREDYVEEWLKVYTSDRRTRFNEMEYHVPIEEGPKAIAEIIALGEKHFPEVYFPLEVRTVAADEMWLSPFYKRPTCSIAVHHDALEDPYPYFAAIEPIFKRHGGRPHWGKMHTLTGTDLARLYPRWKDAMDVRRELDPDNRFVSPYIARLIGLDG